MTNNLAVRRTGFVAQQHTSVIALYYPDIVQIEFCGKAASMDGKMDKNKMIDA